VTLSTISNPSLQPPLQQPLTTSRIMTKKEMPKKSVAFSSNVKFTRKNSIPLQPGLMIGSDYALQSTDVRRRYMRRGSKAPNMMHLSSKDRSQIEESYTTGISFDNRCPAVRRLSTMSILNCRFDQVTLLEDNHGTLQFR
jgi:hypothetical protein